MSFSSQGYRNYAAARACLPGGWLMTHMHMNNTVEKKYTATRKKAPVNKNLVITTDVTPRVLKMMPSKLRAGDYQIVSNTNFGVQVSRLLGGAVIPAGVKQVLIRPVEIIKHGKTDRARWFKTEVVFSDDPTIFVADVISHTQDVQTAPAIPEDSYQNRVAALEEMLDIEEAQKIMGVGSRQALKVAEKKSRIFSLLPPGRERGAKYPGWQFEPGIEGQPLKDVLAHLGELDNWSKWLFFTSEADRLNGLSPLTVLRGKAAAGEGERPDQLAVLNLSAKARLAIVLEAAREFVSIMDF